MSSAKDRWAKATAVASGAASLTSATRNRKAQKGIPFNLMVVGRSGLGKSTFVNCLVGNTVIARDSDDVESNPQKTLQINSFQEDIEFDGQKIILSVIDTPGFGDSIDNSANNKRILDYIENQYKRFLAEESRVQRNAKFQDTRVHTIVYFITPSGHSLKELDINFMKELSQRANILPVIGKADSLLPSEIKAFKQRIMDEIRANDISIFDFASRSDDDDDIIAENNEFRALLPFSIVSSDQVIESDGKQGVGRKYPWGAVFVENEKHCDFIKLKTILLSTHLETLKEDTNDIHYENYRQARLKQTGVLDSAKIEQELQEQEKSERELKEKEQAEKEKRKAEREKKKRSEVAVTNGEGEEEAKKKKKSSSASLTKEGEDGKKKKSRKKENSEENGEEKDEQ